MFACPSCKGVFSAEGASTGNVLCPQCGQAAKLPESAPPAEERWYFAQAGEKFGPFGLVELGNLVREGRLSPQNMVLREGESQWAPAGQILSSLFPLQPGPRGPGRTITPTRLIWALAGCAALVLVIVLAWSRSFQSGAKAGSSKAASQEAAPTDESSHGSTPADPGDLLLRLNHLRLVAGLEPVVQDDELNAIAQTRAAECLLDPAAAEKRSADDNTSTLILRREPGLALHDALARGSQRIVLLDPQIDRIGLGIAQTDAAGWVTVVDVRRPLASAVLFPADGQRDVPTQFSGGPELPGPPSKQVAGFPITVAFPVKRTLTEIRAALTEGKTLVPCNLLKDRPHPGIGLLPKQPLRPNTLYRVDVALRIDGKPWRRSWSFTTGDDGDSGGNLAQQALARINDYRRLVGVAPVSLDVSLSHGCRHHARYLVINADNPAVKGLGAHEEDRSLPGFTLEGQRAGKGVIAHGQHDPLVALDAWMATFYHRVPLLDPRLSRIGFGCALGARQSWVTVIDVSSAKERANSPIPIVFPADGQTKVPMCFSGNEVPDPIPDDRDGRAGFPVTITFPDKKLTNAKASFKALTPHPSPSGRGDGGEGEVPVWFSAPGRPANPRYPNHQGTTVCLIAQDPLKANTRYRVELSGTIDGRAWRYAWSFTTGSPEPSPEQSAVQVVERINAFRAMVGLGKVTLDQATSRDCANHARYLVSNAARLGGRSFNDEDPKLPGFSAGGRTTARTSAVFLQAPEPIGQISTMIASFQRSYLLDPALRRIGHGCAYDPGRGWMCVLDLNSGRDEVQPMLYPAPEQTDVPCSGLDAIQGLAGKVDLGKPAGFPITVSFPRTITVRDFHAGLTDAAGETIPVQFTTLNPSVIQITPRAKLRAGTTYTVVVTARLSNVGPAWQQTWRFTTAK